MESVFIQDFYRVKYGELFYEPMEFTVKPNTESLTFMLNSIIHKDDPSKFYVVLDSENNYYEGRGKSAFNPLFEVVNNIKDVFKDIETHNLRNKLSNIVYELSYEQLKYILDYLNNK